MREKTQIAQKLQFSGVWGGKLILLLLLGPLAIFAQTVTYAGSPVGSGGSVYIDPGANEFPMPLLQITFNYSSCDTVTARLETYYQDPNTGFTGDISYTSHTMAGNQTWYVDDGPTGWNVSQTESTGGAVTLFYSVNNGPDQYFQFNLWGKNASESAVDAYYAGQAAPWFYGNILHIESDGGQFDANNQPNVEGNPDGIGIGQIDGVENPGDVDIWIYFNYEHNINVSLAILNGKKSESYANWLNYFNASNDTLPPQTNYPDCTFYANLSPPDYGNYGDADWLQDYNGHSNQHWFLWWGLISSNKYGWFFKPNTTEPGAQYVPDACAGYF